MEQYLNHFSHRHPLKLSRLEEEEGAVCFGCELHIADDATYVCTKPNCTFVLHDSCFDLPRQVRHKSHPKHPLSLLFSPPYSDGEFKCDGCGNSGHGFTFHCKTCKFDLHVECASLPEIEYCKHREHPLVLLSSNDTSLEHGDKKIVCYECKGAVAKGCWVYGCLACNCVFHLDCV